MEASQDDENKAVESTWERKVPRAVPIIWINIMLERYSTTGISTILALYLYRKLDFDQHISTAIFHTNELLAYSFTIIGAIIADSWLGLYSTILWMSLVFSVGSAIVSIGAVQALNLPAFAFTIVGLVIAVIGSGSTRANLIAFGALQYKLPEQAEQQKFYFSVQIFFLKIGSLMGRFVNPIFKENVSCFGMDDCYPLGFGTPTIAMICSFMLILFGRSHFIRSPPSTNMLVKVSKCMWTGFSEKFKQQKIQPKGHWLDYAENKHGSKLVAETKIVTNILVLYLPLPIYWAVYMQQGSRWVFQATRMNGDIGFYTVTADQMIVFNPLVAILTLPILDYVIYPMLAKIGIKSLLQRMTIGGFLAVAAFIVSAFIEFKIQQDFVSIFWLVPQYAILAVSENFLFVSHIRFAYTEAPASMKSVMMSFVFVVIAFGNLFVVLISGTKLFESQAVEFFFFAGILFVFMIFFGFLASRYKPISETVADEARNTI